MTTERAPVAGQTTGRSGRSGQSRQSLLDGLIDTSRTGASGNPVVDQLLRNQGRSGFGLPQTPGGDGSGAAAAAGVLTAVDEDNEGDEEAKVPKEFDYFTDDEEEG